MLKKAEKPENVQPAAKRKLTRAERKQIEAIIRQAMGDGEPHTVQDSIHDTCEDPLNIVMKTTACNGMDVAKISDTPGKEMCKNEEYVDYLTRCIQWRLEHDR